MCRQGTVISGLEMHCISTCLAGVVLHQHEQAFLSLGGVFAFG